MGKLSKTQRDIIQGDVENNQTHHLAQYTIDIIKNIKELWGLHMLEILTFIARKLIRKGYDILNQFQIYVAKLQYDQENKDDQVQLWTQQLFQILRLAAINNRIDSSDLELKFLKSKDQLPHQQEVAQTYHYVIRDSQHQKELEYFEKSTENMQTTSMTPIETKTLQQKRQYAPKTEILELRGRKTRIRLIRPRSLHR
ncbi:hypothetical protein OXYTRIMIC_686 [Oxytricha trifallax]|uniref:Uncharacterized protein n=1 Tax=Oxytricha trifallax TaxID=1172189 RepID=A0A073HZG7_9SPIT|nr:hypothetical protein OXYTRIMIC_686 [Oxytricha trifallax]